MIYKRNAMKINYHTSEFISIMDARGWLTSVKGLRFKNLGINIRNLKFLIYINTIKLICIEVVSKRLSLAKIKEEENYNHRNT